VSSSIHVVTQGYCEVAGYSNGWLMIGYSTVWVTSMNDRCRRAVSVSCSTHPPRNDGLRWNVFAVARDAGDLARYRTQPYATISNNYIHANDATPLLASLSHLDEAGHLVCTDVGVLVWGRCQWCDALDSV
jgi:hypothetical protein